MTQLDLFGPPPEGADDLAAAHAEAAVLAAGIDPRLRLGTSSWSFPGWRGLVYSRSVTESSLAREGLREYARHPLLRTVGIDRSFYAPIPADDLRRYAEQLPDGFLACAKAGASVTSAVRLGRATEPNPYFLSPGVFADEMLEPFAKHFRRFTGPFLLEFSPLPRGARIAAAEFLDGLDRFLAALPIDFRYAVELRERSWLTPEYARVLARHRAGHVFNYWTAMPMLRDQACVVAPEQLNHAVVRLLLPPGTRYDDQREAYRPFDRIHTPDPVMRQQAVEIALRAVGRGADVFVLVNNKAEGSSPLTVMEIARLLSRAAAVGG